MFSHAGSQVSRWAEDSTILQLPLESGFVFVAGDFVLNWQVKTHEDTTSIISYLFLFINDWYDVYVF